MARENSILYSELPTGFMTNPEPGIFHIGTNLRYSQWLQKNLDNRHFYSLKSTNEAHFQELFSCNFISVLGKRLLVRAHRISLTAIIKVSSNDENK